MNAVEAVRLRFQSLVARGLAASGVARRVGLAAASEVWGGDRPRDRPAWYLWLRDRPGAWQVELAGAEPLGRIARDAFAGRFTVRHYPSPHAPVFGCFSPEERRAALAALDRTGTPQIELASTISGAFFTVGALEWAVDPHRGAAVVALASLDRLRTRDDRGHVVRDVPGWRLTAPIFSALAGLSAQLDGSAATRLVVSREPGFEAVEGEEGGSPRDVPGVAYGEAFLALAPAGAPRDAGAALVDELRDRDAEVVLDVRLAPGANARRVLDPDPRFALSVCDHWFGGGAHVEDRIMCAC